MWVESTSEVTTCCSPHPIPPPTLIHRLYSNAGDVMTHLGRHDGALEYYRQALMLNPVSAALGGKVALLEIETGNLERGTFLLESLVHRCVRVRKGGASTRRPPWACMAGLEL